MAVKKSAAPAEPKKALVSRLKERYTSEIVPELKKTFNYKSVMEVPRLEKIVLNAGLGEIKDNAKSFTQAMNELELIAGQKACVVQAKKSVSNFKVRAGQNISVMVTLRGDKMWNFLDKLISVALPRVRDFRGLSPKSFDGRGNYALGVREQITFPEISYDQVEKVRGFDVCIVTTAKTDEEGRELLRLLGLPFRK
ncbi:MAG: 50S ribosomal protein L5 [Christensenellales bacterium]|jgi:large subunit ribosomal protein L5